MSGTGLLIKKDWIYLVTSLKSSLITSLLFCLFMPMCSVGFGVTMPALIGYIVTYSVMAYEARSKVELMTVSLPVSRKEMCTSKYIEGMVYLLLGCILTLIGSGIGFVAQLHVGFEEVLGILPMLFALSFCVGAVYNGIILPLVFYFGTVKARLYMMFSYIFIFSSAYTIGNTGVLDLNKMTNMMNNLGSVLPVILIVVGIAVYYISYRVSHSIWMKKDFK